MQWIKNTFLLFWYCEWSGKGQRADKIYKTPESRDLIVAGDVSTHPCPRCVFALSLHIWIMTKHQRKEKKQKKGSEWNYLVSFLCTILLQRPLQTHPRVLAASYTGWEKSFLTQTWSWDRLFLYIWEKDSVFVCVYARVSPLVEHHWGWRMKLLTSAGTGLVNLLLFPSSTSSSPLSHFGCASRSKGGSLIRGVCVSTLYTCVYVSER